VPFDWDQPSSLQDLFEATADPPPEPLVANLIPRDGIVLLHGQPREGKSLIGLELCIALAVGTPAFRLPASARRWTERGMDVGAEDRPRRVAERLQGTLTARRMTKAPEALAVLFPQRFSVR
jgi:RecA-family ATPase